MLAPVELAAVDDHTADGGAVAADPLGRGMDDDVGAVVDGADEEATGSECVVNLVRGPLSQHFNQFTCWGPFRGTIQLRGHPSRGQPW